MGTDTSRPGLRDADTGRDANTESDAPVSDEGSVGRLLNEVANRLLDDVDRQARIDGITAAQWRVLMRIASGLDATAADLCRSMRYDSGSMTRMLDRLEARGLVRRTRCTEDRRVIQVDLTEEGAAVYPRVKRIGQNVLDHYLKDFTPDEIAVLTGLLRRLAAIPPLKT
ncbi:MarR family transcriptional regulator [Roseospira marina]|uniref:MarR family transcriptional regulator n=1 Tax=Roseospira marina TaxID=140057 RepID=A0A5M6I7U0_9PROT|nr:MarR family transcriptional regulator [Roseospira marina]KAA5603799.1 MarR family transcriptional regulator [Roseospira marina]MBB4316008.1 DNA-binding MarR family transcriptional regulator [Roseospira marina]MBB5089174.1 DNA-binding MarR family transcriptional regulator [Roseospira marina]